MEHHLLDRADATDEERRLKLAVSTRLGGTDVAAKRAEVLSEFHRVYDLYERLFDPLRDEGFYKRADPLRHPLIFYLGHTACFYINKLLLAGAVKERVDPRIESLCAIGVDEMQWDDILSDDYEWPAVKELRDYRDTVRGVVDKCIRETPLELPIRWDSPFYVILMGIEHERIHLETSSVLVRFLPLSALKGPSEFWAPCPDRDRPAPANELLQVTDAPEDVRLGIDVERHDFYAWDNELGELRSTVPPFRASRYLVTNREFHAFVVDGGYERSELWTDEGWRFAKFRASRNALHPPFWVPDAAAEGGFRLRLMLEEVDMPWSWPVEVNQLESKAFCNWMRARTGQPVRLPTEDEYAVLRRREVPSDYPEWGDRPPANVSLQYYASSTPVDAFPPSPGGFYDVVGNVWCHTETPIDALPGFRVHKVYDDFSVPTFDLMHNIIASASWISMGNEANPVSRYAFRRHFYQHAGFRYVETPRDPPARNATYELDSVVHTYCHFHYGPDHFGVPNFQVAIARLALERAAKLGVRPRRALDIGCATGRGVFELARSVDYVLGLDFSARFIRKAVELQETGVLRYTVNGEGDEAARTEKTLLELGLDEVSPRCEFYQADACNLDPRYDGYDLVVASNLIDRLYDPTLFLGAVHERMTPGGVLVIASPYDWKPEHTPPEAQLGGYVNDAGVRVSSLDGLRMVLEQRFDMVGEPVDVPFVMRESPRRFQHTLSQVTVWHLRT